MNTVSTPIVHNIHPIAAHSLSKDAVLPTPPDMVDGIVVKDGRYNGYPSLLDAFLALLPESLKVAENDSHIERLYSDVKRAMRSPSRNVFLDSQDHWALL